MKFYGEFSLSPTGLLAEAKLPLLAKISPTAETEVGKINSLGEAVR
jgi:hypothetical protein